MVGRIRPQCRRRSAARSKDVLTAFPNTGRNGLRLSRCVHSVWSVPRAASMSRVGWGVTPEWRARIDDGRRHGKRTYSRVATPGSRKVDQSTTDPGECVGYYGRRHTQYAGECKGHEPQKNGHSQKAEVCGPDATMLEFGAYWGFYSLGSRKSLLAEMLSHRARTSESKVRADQFAHNREQECSSAYVGSTTPWRRTAPIVSVDGSAARKASRHQRASRDVRARNGLCFTVRSRPCTLDERNSS